MSEGRKGAEKTAAVDHAACRVIRHPDGGYVLETGGRAIRVAPGDGGWVVKGDDDFDGWSLRRASTPGFVLHSKGGSAEAARSMPPLGTGAEAGLRFLLLEDGRLYRIVLRGPRDGVYELTGWETTGAYLTARPETEGWSLEPTTACGGLNEIRVLCLMLAAEVLDADGAMGTRTP